MAIAVKTKEDVTLLFGEQASFGTVLADNAAFDGTTPAWGEILDCEVVSLDWDVRQREPNRSHTGSRVMLSSNYQQDEKGASPKFVVTGDAKKATLATMLYAVTQNVSEAAGSPYEKTYTFSSTQPDFTANAGWFGTLIVKQGSSQSQKVRDMICSELTLTCNPEDGQGRMQMVANLQGRGTPSGVSNPSGATARYAQSFFYFHDLKTCTVNGSAVVPLGITIKIKNNAIPVGVNLSTAGDFLTYALPKYEVDVTIKAHWDTNALASSQDAQISNPGPYPIVLTWGTDNADGYLNWTIYGIPTPSPDVYDPVKAIDMTFKGAYDGTNAPLTVVLADLIDRAW